MMIEELAIIEAAVAMFNYDGGIGGLKRAVRVYEEEQQ